ncbi:MAG: hypothetical protein J07HX64_01993 [halophilic archaeon J07HX64]|nr:MAG: hypothetical protein J07HX64_01993 [halophilic archaeon J07HX64]
MLLTVLLLVVFFIIANPTMMMDQADSTVL